MSSLENALRIMACFDEGRRAVRVAELARDLSLPKSSVSRLLRALAEFRVLERGDSELAYQLGPRISELAELRCAKHSLAELADATVTELVAEFGFTGYVSMLSGADIVLLRVRQGSYPLRHVRDIGTRLPAARTAMGKALLSCSQDDEVLARFSAALQNGAASEASFLGELATTRRDGFVKARSQLTPGITTIAAAVQAPPRSQPIAIAIAFPDSAVGEVLETQMCRRVAAKAREMAAALGDKTASTGH